MIYLGWVSAQEAAAFSGDLKEMDKLDVFQGKKSFQN